MPFFRSLDETAPNHNRELAWPIHGSAYLIAFIGPLGAGLAGGSTGDWRSLSIGLLMGIGVTLLNAWLSDRFLDPWIARFQRPLHKGVPWIFANIAAFTWGIALCALAMLAPIAYFR